MITVTLRDPTRRLQNVISVTHVYGPGSDGYGVREPTARSSSPHRLCGPRHDHRTAVVEVSEDLLMRKPVLSKEML